MPKGRQVKAERTKQSRSFVPVVESGDAIDNEYLKFLFSCSRRAFNAVSAIIDEIVDKVAEKASHRHLERQQLPFTVNLMAQAILEIVECNFPPVQPLESEDEEDEELEPIPIHPWAQGVIPKKLAPAMILGSANGVKENSALMKIERSSKSVITMGKATKKKTGAKMDSAESSQINKKPIQEKEFIPGWSKRPPGFRYIPHAGAVLNNLNMEDSESSRKLARSRSKEKSAKQKPLRALNLLKNNLSQSVVFDADGNILATLPLAQSSTVTSSRVRLRPLEKAAVALAVTSCPSHGPSKKGTHALWQIGQKQEVHLHESKLLNTSAPQQTGRRKGNLTLPSAVHTDDRSQNGSIAYTIAEAIRLAPGVSLWDGTNLFTNRPLVHSGDRSH